MTLKAYYDGGGKPQDCEFITLAGVAGPEEAWPRFDALWNDALKAHHLKSWHTSDAMQGKPDKATFVESEYRNTWDEAKAQAAYTDLKMLIYRFLTEEHKQGFQVLSCTVKMADYLAVKETNPSLRPVEAICVNTCVGSLVVHDPHARLQLYFDFGESFMKYVYQVWVKGKKRSVAGWPQQIQTIVPVESSKVCALQAADLVAWDQNRLWARTPNEAKRVSKFFGLTRRYYDQPELEQEYPSDRERGRIERLRKERINTSETHRPNLDEEDDPQ